MKLENYEVHLPSYSIGDHIYDKIGPVCESYGKTVLLIGGRRALKAAEEKIRTYVAKTNLEIIGVELYVCFLLTCRPFEIKIVRIFSAP